MKKNDINNFFINEKSIFSVLTTKQKKYLQENVSLVNYNKDELIFKEGFKPSGLICLLKGKVKIYKEGVAEKAQIFRLLNESDFIGFRALFAEDYYNASALTIEDSEIRIIDKKALFNLIDENSDLAKKIIKYLALELGEAENRIISLTQKHLRGRLAESLVKLFETYGLMEDEQTLQIKLSRKDLADLSNMTTSNAIRTLYDFVEEKIIEIDKKIIKIIDMKKLEKISEIG